MASKKGFFEEQIKKSAPGYDPNAKELKPVGQREWTPTKDNKGAHNSTGYKANVGAGKAGPPPPKSLADLP